MGYGITIRVSGKYALSYDVITPSAARGILDAVYWKPAIRWVIDKIHVLNEIKFTNIRRNEVSEKVPTREVERRIRGSTESFFIDAVSNRQQRAALVLKDVDYAIESHFVIVPENAGPEDDEKKHYNIALRRLRNGQYFHAPYLGTREFSARVELIEDRNIPNSPLTGAQDLGWMLYDLNFSDPDDIRPNFFKAQMMDGVIDLTHVELKG